MAIRRTIAAVLAAILTAGLVALLASSAGAQTTLSRLVFINGASSTGVDVVVNGTSFATQLEFATASGPFVGESGAYAIGYSDGSSFAGDVPPATAWTIVSGFGEDPNSATAYPVTVAAIPDGEAVVAVWNATATDLEITVGGSAETVAPGALHSTATVAAGSVVTVAAAGVSVDVAPQADNYIDVFAVASDDATGIAQAVIPAMAPLVEAITPPSVPDVVGQSAEDATEALAAAGFQVAEETAPSDTVAAGVVISMQPAAGTELASGSVVTIVVSGGPSTVPVPDVVGMPVADAQSELTSAGLTATVTERSDSEIAAGIVIETNPSAGIAVAPGTAVTVVVSSGPPDVQVPDLYGLTADQAATAVEAFGLTLTVTEDPDDPDPDGLVVEQDPAPGAVVPAGTAVSVQLSPAVQDPWTSIKLDPNRILTAGGINFEAGSVSDVSILTTTLSATDVVGDNGQWVLTIDTNSLDPTIAYEVLVTGTAEDGSAYERTFDLPAVGQTTDEPQEEDSDGVPAWVWLVAIIALVAIVAIAVLLVRGRGSGSDGDGSGEAATEGTDEAPDDAAPDDESPPVTG